MVLLDCRDGTSVASTESSGGNPGAYRKVSLTVDPFQNVANRQLWSVAKYTPARQGPVTSVSLSYDLTRVLTSTPGATQIVKGIAVQQGGVVYTLIQGVSTVAPPNWDSFSVADLVPLFPAVNWKDGTEITFGIFTSVSTSETGFTIAGGYDNFTVTVHYAPPVPLLQFRFEEGTGTTVTSTGSVAKVSGKLQEGKNAGNGPRFSSDTPQGIASAYSLQFDGINDMVRMTDVFDYTVDGKRGSTPLTQLTVEAWIKPANVSGSLQRTIWDDYGNPGVYFALAGDRVQLSVSTAANPGMGISNFSGKITPGVWQHVAAVYNGQQLTLYVDGQQTESTVATTGAIPDNTSAESGRRLHRNRRR